MVCRFMSSSRSVRRSIRIQLIATFCSPVIFKQHV
ncbi:Uncharacterised protein [Vibrio cholerae]|nr:Uncharacterised protein [Vibrio cholerae]